MTEERVKFGLAEYKGAIAGLKFTSVQTSPNAQKAKLLDEDGEEFQRDYYDHEVVITIEANVTGDISAVVPGATVTIDDAEYYVDSAQRKRGNTAHETVSLTLSKKGTKAANAAAAAAATTATTTTTE